MQKYPNIYCLNEVFCNLIVYCFDGKCIRQAFQLEDLVALSFSLDHIQNYLFLHANILSW